MDSYSGQNNYYVDVRSIALSQKELGTSVGDQPDHITDGGKSQSYMFHLLADI